MIIVLPLFYYTKQLCIPYFKKTLKGMSPFLFQERVIRDSRPKIENLGVTQVTMDYNAVTVTIISNSLSFQRVILIDKNSHPK